MSYHYKELTTTQTIIINKTLSSKPKAVKIAHLIVLKSPEGISSQQFYPIQRQLILRRKDSADIALNDPKLSRQHFQIYSDGKHYYIKDLNSTNGTKVNGELIKEKKIHPKDIIESGDFRFEFNFPSIVPHRSKKLSNQHPSSLTINILTLIKTALIATLITLCAYLLYCSATKSFKTEEHRSPQSLNTERKGESWSKTQANLFYQMAAEAYNDGDYFQAKQFISQAKQFSKSVKFDSFDRAIDEATTLKTVYCGTVKTREEKEKIEIEIRPYLESAHRFIQEKALDKAVISYQEVLLIDSSNEEAKNGIVDIEKLKNSQMPTEKKETSSSALSLYQIINKIVAEADELEDQEKFSLAIEKYKKALSLAKKYEFNVNDIASRLLDTVNTFRDKTKTLWETADTLSQAQKYAEAKEKMIQILRMNPDYTPALEKKKELDQILSQQAQRLYSQAVVYESLPDIEGAKEKWRTILTLLDTSHLYYKKAQQKLSHYSSY